MKYTMTDPCPTCPFRNDRPPFLTGARARSIVYGNAEFQCHKTVDYTSAEEDDEGEAVPITDTKNAQHCAGLLILLEHMEQPHQMMRINERLGMYDARKLNMKAPVYTNARAFIAACTKTRKRA